MGNKINPSKKNNTIDGRFDEVECNADRTICRGRTRYLMRVAKKTRNESNESILTGLLLEPGTEVVFENDTYGEGRAEKVEVIDHQIFTNGQWRNYSERETLSFCDASVKYKIGEMTMPKEKLDTMLEIGLKFNEGRSGIYFCFEPVAAIMYRGFMYRGLP
jgi:hypothetical protein